MKAIVTFFSTWFARWRNQKPFETKSTEQAGEIQEHEPFSEIGPVVEDAEAALPQAVVTHNPVPIYPQLYDYSCTAAVFQAISAYFGVEVTHPRAIRLTRCKPNGASLAQVTKALKNLHQCAARRLVRADTIRRALRNGAVVLAGDRLTYSEDHAVLIFGCTDDYFLVLDPAASSCAWKLDSWVFEAGDEFIAVKLKSPRKRRSPRATDGAVE